MTCLRCAGFGDEHYAQLRRAYAQGYQDGIEALRDWTVDLFRVHGLKPKGLRFDPIARPTDDTFTGLALPLDFDTEE